MYTMPRSHETKEEALGGGLYKVKGSPRVFLVNKAANAASDPARQDVPISSSPQPRELSVELLIQWLLRGRYWILLFLILGAVAGAVFGILAKPKFSVTTEMLIDPTDLKIMPDDLFSQNNQRDTQVFDLETKLTVLTSGNVLKSVVQNLDLGNDPEFADAGVGNDEAKQLEALRALGKHVSATREDRSFVINLEVWSQSATKAITIADAIVVAFQNELAQAQADGAGLAAKALLSRLDTLKGEVAKADNAAQRFKRENNLQSSSGELVSSLIANEVNIKLVEAEARVIEARSRYKKLSTGLLESRIDTASIDSQTMTSLRIQYGLLKKELDARSSILGAKHPTILTLRPQLEALKSQIKQEAALILEAAKSELTQAESALMALQAQAKGAKSTVFDEGTALVQLRELEREVQTKSTVYEAYLVRSKEVAERQQISATNVRIISPPTMPKYRSYPPRTLFLIAAGMVVGFGVGCLLAAGLGFWGLIRLRFMGVLAAR